jgi:hypothetical protein
MLQAPKWCKEAVPTLRGWAHPTTGELYVARRFTQEQIDEFYGKVEEAVNDMYGVDHDYVKVNEEVEYEAPSMLHEAPVGHKSLESMTKNELLALAEERGVKVSKFSTKKTIMEKLS